MNQDDIIISKRHPTPIRSFVTKYEPEIISNQRKRKSRARERDSKYAEHFELASLDDDIAAQDLNERIIIWKFRWNRYIHNRISDKDTMKFLEYSCDDIPNKARFIN
jgi:hypothetical protein